MKRPPIPTDPTLPTPASVALLRGQPIDVLKACVRAIANGHVVCIQLPTGRDYLVRPDYLEEAIYTWPYGAA